MARHLRMHQIAMRCAIQGPGCFKLDGDGGGYVRLSFDASQNEELRQLYKDYREVELIVVFSKAAG